MNHPYKNIIFKLKGLLTLFILVSIKSNIFTYTYIERDHRPLDNTVSCILDKNETLQRGYHLLKPEKCCSQISCLFDYSQNKKKNNDHGDVFSEQKVRLNSSLVNPKATINIEHGAIKKEYDPRIFGGFLEHFGKQVYGGVFDPGSPLSDNQGFRKDVMEALKELKVPIVRWPGGCFVSGYHWEYGVGSDRKAVDDMAWGVVEPNTFGTDEFIDLSKKMGWEPFICNNAGNGTIEDMRNWVEYTNGKEGKFAQLRKINGYPNPRNVKIWSIGNENWGDHEIGNKSIQEWVPLVVEAAIEMKSIDPDIQLSAAAMNNREWSLPLLEKAGPYLEYISIHQYWLPLWWDDSKPDYLTCIIESEGPRELLDDYIGILDESGYRGKIKIAFDEWNLRAWYHPKFPRKTVQDYDDPEIIELVNARKENLVASQYTMADALFTGSFFNACLQYADDIAMANIAPLVNTRGPLYVHPDGIVKRTHFHAMAMYANLLGPIVVDSKVESDKLQFKENSIPVMDAVVTKKDKEWIIAVINRHPRSNTDLSLIIEGTKINGKYKATILTADTPEAYNDIEHPDRVVPVEMEINVDQGIMTIPPHSLIIFKINDI